MALTREEIAAVTEYSGAAYNQINSALRSGEEMDKDLSKTIERLDSAIANAESRIELAVSEGHARKLADAQAALRRVATLVADEF